MHKLIGVHGWARSGKDEAANVLALKGWERRAFADPLRDLAAAANPIMEAVTLVSNGMAPQAHHLHYQDYLEKYGYDEAKSHGDFRPFLQRLGDGARRVFGDDFWVDMAMANLTTDTIWTDVRYVGEGDAIRSRGGIVVKIMRPGTGPANTFEAEHHAMEDYPFDLTISNDGSLAAFHAAVLDLRHRL